jgi:hypothetical protein
MTHRATVWPPSAATALVLVAFDAPALWRAGSAVKLPTRKSLALAVLMREGPVGRERLAQTLWPGVEPGAARRNLRRELFRLRQAGVATVDGPADTVRLPEVALHWPDDAGAEEIDWLPGLDDVAGVEWQEWLQTQRGTLQRQWLAHLAEAAHAAEHAGREPQALALWQRLVTADADGRAGAQARQQARRLHQLLGEHTQALALVQGSAPATQAMPRPAAAPPTSLERSMLPPRLPFVGRESALAQVRRAMAAGQLVFIDGAPGAGKTRLALEAVAASGGALLASCRPEDPALPFASATRLLQQLREAAPGVLPPAWARHELQLLVPEWADGSAVATDAHQLLRLRRAFETAWRLLAADNFGALVIDDWQWADDSSLVLWGLDEPGAALPLGPQSQAMARLIVHRAATLTPAALERRRQWLDSGRAGAVSVAPLDAHELLALLRQLARTDGGERFAARLHHATGGNPLFLQETLRHLAAQGLLAADEAGRWHTPFDAITEAYEELPVPGSVHEAVLARVRALGASVRRVLEAASLAGSSFSARDLAAAAGLDELASADALAHAGAALLVEPAGPTRLRFTHDLVAEALAGALAPARRAALHSQLADARASRAGPAEAAAVADHLHAADRDAQAAAWHEKAGRHASSLGRWAETAERHRRAAAAARMAGDADAAARNETARAQGIWRQGNPQGAEAAFDAAMADATRAGAARGAEVLVARAEWMAETGRAESALQLLQGLLADAALPGPIAARAQEAAADTLAHLGRPAEAVPLLRELLARVPVADAVRRLRLQDTLARAQQWAGDIVDAERIDRSTLTEVRRLGWQLETSRTLQRLASHARDLGRKDEALTLAREAATLAGVCGNLHGWRASLYTMVVVHADAGDVDAALPLIDEAEQAAPFWDNPHLQQAFAEARYYLHYLRGDEAGARVAIEASLALARASDNLQFRMGGLHMALDLFLMLRDAARARALLAESESVLAGASGDTIRSDELPARRLQVWLLEPPGHANESRLSDPSTSADAARDWPVADDLAACRAAFERGRIEEQLRIAGTLARVSAAQGDAAAVQAWIQRGCALEGGSVEQRAQMAAAALQALSTLRATPPAPAAGGVAADVLAMAEAAARTLLGEAGLPAFERRLLETALQASHR